MVVGNYLSLIKFSHTLFALPFALVGFYLGVSHHGGVPNSFTLLLVVLCMVFARSAAMAFNRYIDRNIDKQNERTKTREIPSGAIRPNAALLFVIANSLLFIACTAFINKLCLYLSPVALLVILGYSYTKRFTWLCHFVLGIGLSLAPIGAYLAVTAEFHLSPLLLSFAVLFWVTGFDIIYALQDEEFDKSQQLYSIPTFLGKRKALMLSNLLHAFTTLLLIYFGVREQMDIFYWIGSGIFILLLIYQHTIVKPNDLSRVNLAFFTTNGIASVLYACFFIASFYL